MIDWHTHHAGASEPDQGRGWAQALIAPAILFRGCIYRVYGFYPSAARAALNHICIIQKHSESHLLYANTLNYLS